MGYPTKFDEEKRGAYLLALERSGEVTAASASVGVCRQTIYQHMHDDDGFRDACERAVGRLIEKAMAVAKTLALEGLVEKFYDPKTGELVREKRTYSERILLKLLARHQPREWGDKVAIDQTVKGDVKVTRVEPKELTRPARNRVRDLLDELPSNN